MTEGQETLTLPYYPRNRATRARWILVKTLTATVNMDLPNNFQVPLGFLAPGVAGTQESAHPGNPAPG